MVTLSMHPQPAQEQKFTLGTWVTVAAWSLQPHPSQRCQPWVINPEIQSVQALLYRFGAYRGLGFRV